KKRCRRRELLTKLRAEKNVLLSRSFRAYILMFFLLPVITQGSPALKRARELPGGKVQCPIQSAARLHGCARLSIGDSPGYLALLIPDLFLAYRFLIRLMRREQERQRSRQFGLLRRET